MKTSSQIAQQIILCMRYFDRTNEAITEHLQYLINQYNELIKIEKK